MLQDGRIEIKSRPQKNGWLEQQVNSVFNIWQSNYFVLDGTELLVFDDDQRQQPIASINLHRCIVDGIWQQNERNIITIRSLNQDMEEQFIQLGSMSMQELSEWKETLKSAIILLEYETLFKQLEQEEQLDRCKINSDETISDIDSDDFQEHPTTKINSSNYVYTSQNIPTELQKIKVEIDSIFLENQNAWKLQQVESQLRIYKQLNTKNSQFCYKLQGYLENIDFDQICSIFSDPLNDQYWDFYLIEKELCLKVRENYEVYKTKEQFYSNKQTHNFSNVYREICWFDLNGKNRVFYQLRQNIQDEAQNIANSNTIPLKIQQQIIKLEQVKKGYIQISVYVSVPLKHIQQNSIIVQYLMERLVNFSVFIFEFKEIVDKVQQRQRRLMGDEIDIKIHMYQPLKTQTQIEADNEDDISYPKSIVSQRNISNQKSSDPSWDEDTHLRLKKLNEEQLEIFFRFKTKNFQLKLSDNEYIQFLVARKYDEENAQEMIDNWSKWRLENKFDSLSIDDFPHLHRLKAYRYIGKDPQGRPIGFGVSRYIFPEQLPCDYDEYCLYYMVYLNHMRKLADGHVDQIIMINDVGGLNSANVDLSLTRKQLKLVLDLFPEGVFKLIAVNVDFYCRFMWSAIKPFLEKNTQEKIVIVGSDTEEIHKTLLQYMDDDLIPAIYGGKNQIYSSY